MNWISVKDRMPEDGETVLVADKKGHIALTRRENGYFDFGWNIDTAIMKVEYWCSPPEPPKGG